MKKKEKKDISSKYSGDSSHKSKEKSNIKKDRTTWEPGCIVPRQSGLLVSQSE